MKNLAVISWITALLLTVIAVLMPLLIGADTPSLAPAVIFAVSLLAVYFTIGVYKRFGCVLGGVMVGGFIGFLLRPSIPIYGQLPLSVVVTRGITLSGVDVLLTSTAEVSFNYLMIGTILGAIGGGILGYVIAKNVGPVTAGQQNIPLVAPSNIDLGNSPEQVGAVLGQPEKTINLGSKIIYVYKDMKVVFVDGKVTDVQ